VELKVSGNNVEINGVIKTIENVEEIKSAMSSIDSTSISLKITDSFAMPSALIGYLIKLKQLENKQITLRIGDEGLYELVQDLNLDRDFNLQKI